MVTRRPHRFHGASPIRRLVICLLAIGLAVLSVQQPVATAAENPCPEPNDEFQEACFLGLDSEALGFISGATDVDAYRIEAFDSNVQARIELAESPAVYAFVLGDWNGNELATSTPLGNGAVIDTVLSMPGSYYLFVQSRNGTFSASTPYRLGITLTHPYADALKPRLRFSQEFREPEYLGWQKQMSDPVGDVDADFFDIDGRFTIRVNKTGIAQEWPRVASAPFGPEIDDFIMTADARVSDQDSAKGHTGYRIGFRWVDPYHQYSVVVDVEGRRVWLNKVDGESMKETVPLTEPHRTRAIDNKGGVNRTTIQAIGDEIRISINGEEVIHVADPTFRGGRFNFVAAGWGSGKPLVSFDNVLITTPSGAPR